MDRAQYQQAYDIFLRLADLPTAQREAELAAECGDDPELHAFVSRLLSAGATG